MNTDQHKLQLDDYIFEVDLNDRIIGKKINPEMASVGATLILPYRKKCFFKKVKPKGKFNYLIKLTGNSSNDNELSQKYFDENSSPISFMINNCDVSSKGTFNVDGCETKLTLFFDGSAVKDCPKTLTEDRLFELPFQLVISHDNGKSEFTFTDKLKVKIKKFTSKLVYKFIDQTSHLVYSLGGKPLVPVGKLIVEHNASFSCAPDINNQRVKLGCILNVGKAKKESQRTQQESTNRYDILQLKKNEAARSEIQLNTMKAGNREEFSVLIDMRNVSNPLSEEYPVICSPTVYEVKIGQFQLYRNTVLIKRRTTFCIPSSQGGMDEYDITERNNCDLHELLIVRSEDTEYPLKLRFFNDADIIDSNCTNAAVLVWGVQVKKVEGDNSRILLRKGQKLKDIFQFHSNKTNWILNPRFGKSCEFEMVINAGDVVDIVPSKDENETFVDVTIHIEYNVKEDTKGNYYYDFIKGNTDKIQESKHSCRLKLRLKKQPQSEWLCVDFGTSAVVAAYAKDARDEDKSLIDLKALKGHFLDIIYKDPGKKSIEDEDDNLISSTICFNNDKGTADYNDSDIKIEDFTRNVVWFSPSARDIQKDYLLPCLKIIIGYKELPNVFTQNAIDRFIYKRGEKEIRLFGSDGKPTDLMKVSVVSKIIYRQLFKYYLSQRLSKKNGLDSIVSRNVNKLVLSVPNTYTPLEIKTVRDLARESMPNIHPEYLHTISESDAVACYYVSHHERFMKNVDEATKEQLKNRENVLVYDMGAGTLDLTWFIKKTTRENDHDKIDVTIKGKLGINKAGNYLDYELATILLDLYRKKRDKGNQGQKDDEKFELALQLDRSTAHGKMSESKDRTDLKNYVKELKKLLSDKTAKVPQLEIAGNKYIIEEGQSSTSNVPQQGVILKMEDILNHKHFDEVINEMTGKVLENFGKRYGDNNGKIDIDVLIFSGRSTSLQAIREGVKNNIGIICRNPKGLHYADLGSGSLSDNITLPAEVNNSLLKTVVAQGALAYATLFARGKSNYQLHNDKYYASFGLVEYHNNGYRFVPLIAKGAKGMRETDSVITSQEYMVDTELVRQVDLIQSYSSDVVSDYKNGNFDTISKLSEKSCEGFDYPIAQLIMRIHNESGTETTLEFKFGQGSDRFDPHDDFNNLSLRKSLWPVIFDNEED